MGRAEISSVIALSGLVSLVPACTRNAEPIPTEAPPAALLEQILADAEAAGPELALHVADGALTTASLDRLRELSEKAMDWGLAAGDEAALMSLTQTLARRGQVGTIELLLTRAPPSRQVSIRTAFLEIRAEAGAVDLTQDGLERLPQGENADRVRLALIRTLAGRDRLAQAAQLAGAFTDPRKRDEALAAVAVGRARRGQLTAAESALATIRSSTHRDEAIAAIALSEYQRGRRRAGTSRAARIESRWIRSRALADLAHEAARRRRPDSQPLFAQSRSEAEAIDDPLLRGTALAHLAEQLEAIGRTEKAEEVLARVPDEAAAAARAARIRRYVERGRLSAAQREAAGLSASGLIAGDAEAAVARLEAERGALDDALARTARILIPALRWRTAGVVAGLAPAAPVTPFRTARLEAILRDL